MVAVRRGVVGWWMMMFVLLLTMKQGVSKQHVVGGSNGWKPGVNYTQWANTQLFYVGEWLRFNFDRHMFDLLLVNETDYNHCNADHFVRNLTTGAGREVFQFVEVKTYYFIGGRSGGCWNGMKLAAPVQAVPPPPVQPPSSSQHSSAPRDYHVFNVLFAILLIGFMMLCQFQ